MESRTQTSSNCSSTGGDVEVQLKDCYCREVACQSLCCTFPPRQTLCEDFPTGLSFVEEETPTDTVFSLPHLIFFLASLAQEAPLNRSV